MGDESIILRAQGIAKAYDDFVVVHDIDFEVKAGQSIALVGPSGSGKSTLLSMLGLLLEPSSGSIEIKGQVVDFKDDERIARLRRELFGFVFQHAQLIGSLRAWENVAVPARFLSRGEQSEKEFDERAKELLCMFGLKNKISHYPFQLSIGQKRRVALARALLLDPPIIIADEPTNDLDAVNAQGVVSALFDHAKQGGALIYTTHDQDLPEHADVIFRLNDGKIS